MDIDEKIVLVVAIIVGLMALFIILVGIWAIVNPESFSECNQLHTYARNQALSPGIVK